MTVCALKRLQNTPQYTPQLQYICQTDAERAPAGSPADVVEIANAWSELSDTIRQAILSIVRASMK